MTVSQKALAMLPSRDTRKLRSRCPSFTAFAAISLRSSAGRFALGLRCFRRRASSTPFTVSPFVIEA
ncbi:hypothetical protein [Haladaptatus halobius]|uniref:hypothetical protein n=1 Tax=Haladaptatus halobius TaxID=2884875 RepID=UPI001D0B2FAC|nr:hypothetical protein [Haladaptatus halobius]